MSVLPGFEDLKPKRLISAGKHIAVGDDGKAVEVELYVGPGGGISARPITPAGIDQDGKRESVPVEQRWAGVDQV